MSHLSKDRIRHCPPWQAIPVALAFLIAPSLADQRLAEGRAQESPARSSYDQIAPVLLGKETFQDRDGQGQGRQGRGHGPPEGAAGGALRPRLRGRTTRSRCRAASRSRSARPTKLPRGHDLGDAGRDVPERDPREGPVPQGLPAAAPSQA